MATTLGRVLEPTRGGVGQPRWRRMARTALLASGIGSSAAYVAANIAGALRGADYSSLHQTVSELTAIDAPSRPVALPLFVASDVLSLAFGIGVLASAGRNRPLRVAGWLLVGVGAADLVSPFTPMHTREVLAAGGGTVTDNAHLVVLGATTLLIMSSMGFGAAALGKRFRRYSIASLVTMLVAGGLSATQGGDIGANRPTPWGGVYERISIGVYLLWMTMLAIALLRANGRARTHGQGA